MMSYPTVRHEDERRILIEFIHNEVFRTAKVLYLKKDSLLGNHYHNKKDDVFFLLKGAGTATLDGKLSIMNEGDCIYVKAGTVHSFHLKEDSILIEASTLPYDKEDEIQVSY